MKKILILIVVIAISAFAWWTISPLFIDKVVEDELDSEIAALLEQNTNPAPPNEPPQVEPGDSSEADPNSSESPPFPSSDSSVVSGLSDETSQPAEGAAPSSFVKGPFPIADTPGHPASGDVRLIRTPTETILRYENYDGTNGPDLKVYLTNDLGAADEFVDLGRAKGNQGNINYTVPADVDIDEYRYVVTWCEAFGVLFDYAEIN